MSDIVKNNETESIQEIELENTDIKENKQEPTYDIVSLKEIKKVIENKVNKEQKYNIAKKVFINIGIAIIMIIYLILILMGGKNIEQLILEKDVKIICLCILGIGIFILEKSYQKDNSECALNGVEVIFFGATNLCLVYIVKLYFYKLFNAILYIGSVVIVYYVLKSIIMSIVYTRKYKKENSDIKDIVKR